MEIFGFEVGQRLAAQPFKRRLGDGQNKHVSLRAGPCSCIRRLAELRTVTCLYASFKTFLASILCRSTFKTCERNLSKIHEAGHNIRCLVDR
jgi:hypothetical protein